MKSITINDNKILDKDINKVGNKVRAILVSDDKILVSHYGGVMLLPGGSIDKGESENEAIIRELQEETGITYKISELRKVLSLKYYQPNYPTREKTKINRLMTTNYFLGQFKGIDLSKVNRTEKEKKDNFSLELLTYDEIINKLNIGNDNPRREYFDRELKEILNVYKDLIEKDIDDR